MYQGRQTKPLKYQIRITYNPSEPPFPTVNFAGTPHRSPRFQDSSLYQNESLRLDIANLTSLGCKSWRGTLNTGLTVFAKLWDGWKFSPRYSEHEASVYYQLRDLWSTTVPEFLGLGNWGFCHIILLSFIEVPLSGTQLLILVSNVIPSQVQFKDCEQHDQGV